MTPHRFLVLLLLPALALCVGGCAACLPDHVAVGVEHDESTTEGGTRRLRTRTNKVDVRAIYDLKPSRP